jgi:choline-sulfatase
MRGKAARRLLAAGVIGAAAVAAVPLVRGWVVRGWLTRVTSSESRPNILLVTLDTTRADRIGAYGYTRARTAHLDRLAAEGVRFERAIAPAPITLPSHASLFTGRYPFGHGVRNNGNFYLSDRFPTLATVLHDRGYRTAAFVSSFILDRRYGLGRGFDEYDDHLETGAGQVVNFQVERRGDRTALAASAWLERYVRERSSQAEPSGAEASKPFFLWLHLYDPHEPYHPPQPFRDVFADRPYDGEIAFVDTIVASVRDRLDKLGLLTSTVIAVVGDHGESLGDHGEETHSMFVYEAVLRVPMILWWPGHVPSGQVVRPMVRVIDLAPTLLALAGAPPLPEADGRSLLPVIERRGPGPDSAYAETYLPLFYMNWSPLRSIQDDRWKYIEAPQPELYDLSRDPGERENLAGRDAPRTAALQRALDQLTGGAQGSMSVGRLDREALEKLAALGYVGAGGGSPGTGGTSGAAGGAAAADGRMGAGPDAGKPDPKAMIAVFNRLRKANSAVREGRFGEATGIAREVLGRDPRNAFATIIMASAHMNQGENRKAISGYRRYLELVPTSAYAHHWIAICDLRLGERESALAEEEAALAIDPKYADAHVLRGGVLAARGQLDAAIGELGQAVDTDPDKPALRLDLAKVLVEAKRYDAAAAQYRRALELQPRNADAHTGFGVLLADQGRLDQGIAEFRRALEIDPIHGEARFDLARALEGAGQLEDARFEYEHVVGSEQAAPEVRRAARERLGALGGGTRR